MDDYNRYVTAVNKIFDYLEKMKAGWNNVDNKNYIDSIDEYKNIVITKAEEMKKPPTVTLEKSSEQLDAEQAAYEKEVQEKEALERNMSQEPQDFYHDDGAIPPHPEPTNVEALGQ